MGWKPVAVMTPQKMATSPFQMVAVSLISFHVVTPPPEIPVNPSPVNDVPQAPPTMRTLPSVVGDTFSVCVPKPVRNDPTAEIAPAPPPPLDDSGYRTTTVAPLVELVMLHEQP